MCVSVCNSVQRKLLNPLCPFERGKGLTGGEHFVIDLEYLLSNGSKLLTEFKLVYH